MTETVSAAQVAYLRSYKFHKIKIQLFQVCFRQYFHYKTPKYGLIT